MIKEVFETEGINCITYRSEGQPEYLLIQAVDDHDIEVLESEFCKIAEGVSSPVLLAAFKVRDWNEDLSPWQAPPVFGNVPFGGKAGETLNFVKGQFKEQLISSIPVTDTAQTTSSSRNIKTQTSPRPMFISRSATSVAIKMATSKPTMSRPLKAVT